MAVTDSMTLESYFDPELERALSATGVSADPHVRHYLLCLLVQRGTQVENDQSLVELELEARTTGTRSHRCRALRNVGDHALFTSGLFVERLKRRGISTRYYRDKGRSAYAEAAGIADRGHGPHAHAMRALSRRFDDYVSVLRKLRAATGLSEPKDAHGWLERAPDLRATCWSPRGCTTLQ